MIKGECENCGASIDIENERECSYCGTKYSKKQEQGDPVIINNYYNVGGEYSSDITKSTEISYPSQNRNGYDNYSVTNRADVDYPTRRKPAINVGLAIFLFLFFPPLGVIYVVLSVLRSVKR